MRMAYKNPNKTKKNQNEQTKKSQIADNASYEYRHVKKKKPNPNTSFLKQSSPHISNTCLK